MDLGQHLKYREAQKLPIEDLQLPEATLSILKQGGLEYISDCLHFYHHMISGAMLTFFSTEFPLAMLDEVKPRIKEMGFWIFEED